MEGLPRVIFTSGSQGAKAKARGSSSSSSRTNANWVAPRPKWCAKKVREEVRSRSPPVPALGGLRVGAPGRLERVSAKVPTFSNQEERDAALASLDKDVKAASTHLSDNSRLGSISSWLARLGDGCFSADAGVLQGSCGYP